MTWQPTWRRLVASTLVLFALVLAVLVWRVQAGDDPALGAATARGATGGAAGTAGSAAPVDPGLDGGQGVVPDGSGDDGSFDDGGVVPQQTVPQQSVPQQSVSQQSVPGPSTHVS